MAGPIEIGVGLDGEAYQRGMDADIIAPTEDAEDTLKAFAKAGDKMGDEIEQAMRVAQEESKKSSVEIEKYGDQIIAASKQARALGTDTKKGAAEAESAVEELGNEAKANLSETVSSFRGDAESVVDIVQGTLGGVIADLGPAGLAAGAASAAGIGLLTAKLQEVAERAEEARQEAVDLANQIVEAGGSIDNVKLLDQVRSWSNEVADNKEWWELWQKSTVSNMEQVRELAQKTGTDTQAMFDAMSGQNTTGALDLLEELEARLKDVSKENERLKYQKLGGSERAEELRSEKAALEKSTQAIRDRLNIQDQAIENARDQIKLTEEQARKDAELARQEELVAAATQARTDAASALQGELDEAVSSWKDYEDAETGALDPGAYLAAMQARMDATSNFNQNVQTLSQQFGLSTDEMQEILDQGLDFAPMLQAIMDSGMAPEFVKQIQQAVGGGQDIIDKTPLGATVQMKADTKEADKAISGVAQLRVSDVMLKADTKQAAKELDDVAIKKRTATVSADADVSLADLALKKFVNQKRDITITAKIVDPRGVEIP